jgi:hypothetical protein
MREDLVRGRRPFTIALVMAGLAAALIGPAPAAAGQPVLTTFDFELFDDSIEGTGPPNTELKVTLKDSSGNYLNHFFVTTDGDGDWDGEFWPDIKPGHRITASDGSNSRTLIVPPLNFKINRVSDVISGKSAPNSQVDITVFNCSNFDDCFNTGTFTRNTNGQGNFSYDSTSNYNLRGNDFVIVEWESAQGDFMSRFLDVPSVNVWVNNNETWGDARPRQDVTVWLFNSQGNQKAKLKDRASAWFGDYGSFFGVNMRPGDFIGSNIASDALWQIPANNPTFDTATDVVTGKCFRNREFQVYAQQGNGPSGEVYGTTNNNGNFSVDLMALDGYDLQSGDLVEIGCRHATGDESWMDFEVP